jgi:ABC-type branched-subunit amino acid transport system ATPase component
MTTLLADNVTIRFGGLTAVDQATIEVPEGSFVGLIGPNGAGKTTLFNAIGGFLAPTSGAIRFGDRDITRIPASSRARLGIGRTFQKLELFGRSTVFDNLLIAAESAESKLDIVSDLLSLPRRRSEEARCEKIAEEMLQKLDLGWARDRFAGDLPVGHARILELGRALCTKPKVLLLDEPSSGLDSEETKEFGELLQRVNDEMGVGILLVEHDMDLVMEVCKMLYVLDFGRIIAQGTPAEIVKNAHVRSAYLGEEDDAAAAAPAER